MSHSRYEELLAAYRDLRAAERAELDLHLAACPACAARLAAYQAMDQKLGALRDAAPTNQLRTRFYAALAQRQRWSQWRAWAGYVAEAAIAVFLIVGVWIVVQSGLPRDIEPVAGTPTPTTVPTAAKTSTPSPTPASTTAPTALQVVFIKEGNVWLWREGAQTVPLIKDGGASCVRISPDGKIVAFVRGGELWAVNTDGAQGLRRLVSAADLSALTPNAANTVIEQFAWQPGSHKLTYNTRPAVPPGPGQSSWNDDLHQVDADSLAKSTLLAPGQGGDFYYSPDGSRIAIVSADKISLVNADGTNRHDVLTYSAAGAKGYPTPIWAANGSDLAVAIPFADSSAWPPQGTTIWRLPADGSAATPIAKVRGPYPWNIAVSPDLAYIAYLQQPEGAPADFGANPVLAITALGKDETTVYMPGAQGIYGWAPDSQHLAFLAGQPQAPQALIGQLGAQAVPACDNPVARVSYLRWVDARRYLFLIENTQSRDAGWDFVLREIGGTDQVLATLDNGSPTYDFAH